MLEDKIQNTKVIIQARMTSKRLPGKVLFEIKDKPVIDHVLDSVQQVFDKQNIVIATSSHAENKPLVDYLNAKGFNVFIGDEENVASRFFKILVESFGEYFVRICADSPLFDPHSLKSALEKLNEDNYELISTVNNKTAPSGANLEIIKRSTFLNAYPDFREPQHFEHVTKYFYENSERFKICNLKETIENPRQYKLTLDTADDLKTVKAIFNEMDRPHYLYSLKEKCDFYKKIYLNNNPMENLENKKVLLIGGAGFIGHNLALSLKDKGADVYIYDSLQVNNLAYLNQSMVEIPNRELYIDFIKERLELLREKNIPIFVEDARDYHKMSQIFNQVQPDVVVVLAAVSHANRSNKDPYTTFDHSFRTLENALDNSKGKVDHFIYFSSSMVYGDFPEGGVTEDTPCNPKGIYGVLKHSGEQLVKAYNQVFDLDYTIIRPSALYGERCVSGRVGQKFIENAMTGQEITIQGDGSDRLDFTYIGDLVHGIERVIMSENSRNQIFNLTYGNSSSIADMAAIVKRYFPELKIVHKEWDKLMPKRGVLSVDKAKRLIGYNPQNPLETGFVKYIEWYKKVFNPSK